MGKGSSHLTIVDLGGLTAGEEPDDLVADVATSVLSSPATATTTRAFASLDSSNPGHSPPGAR